MTPNHDHAVRRLCRILRILRAHDDDHRPLPAPRRRQLYRRALRASDDVLDSLRLFGCIDVVFHTRAGVDWQTGLGDWTRGLAGRTISRQLEKDPTTPDEASILM